MDKVRLFDIDVHEKFVETEYNKNLMERAFTYIKAGYPIHLRGAAGVGKTSLAFHIANMLAKPLIVICGSEEISDFELIGGYLGTKQSLTVDNYISSVYKKEAEVKKLWVDGRLVTACKNGYTVIYDEFTRTKPEVNNVLLSVLEEQMVDIPTNYSENTYVKVNPDFRIIFTSNPEEYVGVYKSANALLDRMITIDIDTMDEDTERAIIMAKSGINASDANKILSITKYLRATARQKDWMSLRSSIMVAKIVKEMKINIEPSNGLFRKICKDVYNSNSIISGTDNEKKEKYSRVVDRAINSIFQIRQN